MTHEPMSPRTGSRAMPPPTHFHYSTSRTALLLFIGIALGALGIVNLVVLVGMFGPKSWVFALPCAAIYAWAMFRLSRRFRRGPIVTLDAKGITDRRVNVFVPWTAVRKLYLGPYRGSTSLLVAFASPAARDAALGRRMAIDAMLVRAGNAIAAPGAEWGVPLGPLKCETRQVLDLAQRLHTIATEARPAPARQAGIED